MSYSFTELLTIAREVRDDFNIDHREVLENMTDHHDDFEVDGWRFIACNAALDILTDELGSDEYILGCFMAGFLSDVLDIDVDVIEALQKSEAYEALGKLILSMGKLRDLAQAYVDADGYGHHFNRWDGVEHELSSADYYAFKL